MGEVLTWGVRLAPDKPLAPISEVGELHAALKVPGAGLSKPTSAGPVSARSSSLSTGAASRRRSSRRRSSEGTCSRRAATSSGIPTIRKAGVAR